MSHIYDVAKSIQRVSNPHLCVACGAANPGAGDGQLCYGCRERVAYARGKTEQNFDLAAALEVKARKFRGRYSMVRSVCRQMARKLRGERY